MDKKQKKRLLNKTIRVIKSCENMKQLSTARKYVNIAIPLMNKNHIYSQNDMWELQSELDDLIMQKHHELQYRG
jgi:predicted transglutaminase-like cysteine proteinase